MEYGILGGGCFVKKSHVEIILQLEKSVYRQGQIIRAHIEVSVEQGRHLFFISQFPESSYQKLESQMSIRYSKVLSTLEFGHWISDIGLRTLDIGPEVRSPYSIVRSP